MAEKGEFYSFDEALKELRLKEEELKRLVSEGEIRAFREGDTMKLRKADVENLRAELSGGEVVDLGEVREELVFEDDVELVGDAGLATQEITEADTIIEDDVDVVEDIELEGVAVEEDAVEEVAELDVEEEEPVVARAIDVPEPYEGALVRTLLVVAALLLVLAIPIVLSLNRAQPSGVASSIAGVLKSSSDG